MRSTQVVTDAFDRIRDLVNRTVADLTSEQLADQLGKGVNSIGWLVWHLTRVQDDHVADVVGTEQRWVAGGWADRFALPFDRAATGYGHRPEEVSAVRGLSADLLVAYHDDVHDHTVSYVSGLTDADLDRIVDTSWDPPVTLGVRLVSVVADDLQHVGQAAFLRGILGARAG
ncbi:MAG: DUF664 domain-containing protein [Actinomycetota bacterium]|nr:DUF664 domain-containing protein [Actinomycetota bacterium]